VLLALNLVVWERCELAFLKEFSTSAQLAFYGSSFTITGILGGLPNSFAGACGASLMVQRGRQPQSLNRMVAIWLRLTAMLVFPLYLGMAALSAPVVHLIYGRRYEEMIPVLALMAVMGIPKALSQPAIYLMQAMEKQGTLVYWMIVSAIATVTLDYLLVRYFEALGQASIGATWGNGIAQIIAATGVWLFVIQNEHLVLPWNSLGRLAVSAALMALATYFLASHLLRPLARMGVPALSLPLLVTLISVPSGALFYAFLLKITGSFDPEDHSRLGKLETYFPAPFRPWYNRGLQWIMT
jgi:O-antigen/teichoic acid export membrane protein